ncbi:hypothetical protein DFP73DRAFT_616735, partial [Morchella snyderi]
QTSIYTRFTQQNAFTPASPPSSLHLLVFPLLLRLHHLPLPTLHHHVPPSLRRQPIIPLQPTAHFRALHVPPRRRPIPRLPASTHTFPVARHPHPHPHPHVPRPLPSPRTLIIAHLPPPPHVLPAILPPPHLAMATSATTTSAIPALHVPGRRVHALRRRHDAHAAVGHGLVVAAVHVVRRRLWLGRGHDLCKGDAAADEQAAHEDQGDECGEGDAHPGALSVGCGGREE